MKSPNDLKWNSGELPSPKFLYSPVGFGPNILICLVDDEDNLATILSCHVSINGLYEPCWCVNYMPLGNYTNNGYKIGQWAWIYDSKKFKSENEFLLNLKLGKLLC